MEFTKQYEQLIDDYVEKSNIKRARQTKLKGKGGKLHSYSLEMYGLSESIVRSEFHEYIKRFNLDEK